MNMKEKLVSLRKRNGITQMELAEQMMVSRQAVSRWESGLAVPSTDNLKILSELYKVPNDVLLNDELDLPIEEAGGLINVEGTKKKVSKQAIVAACVLLVAAIFLICMVARPRQSIEETTPIGEMKVETDDPSENVGDFSIGW